MAWERMLPAREELASQLPLIEAATTADRQVVVGRAESSSQSQGASLDALADKPWVESVVALQPIEARHSLPGIRSLFAFAGVDTDGRGEPTTSMLPSLEQLVVDRIRTEALLHLPRLRDLVFDPMTHQVPPGQFSIDLINVPGASERFRIETEGIALLARIQTLERLHSPGFHWRDRVDPIAELTRLRWLSLHGWRNLRSLGRLQNLERLSLVECEMSNLRGYRDMPNLRELVLMGRMKSLDGLEHLATVETLWLRGNVARDLTPLTALPNLSDLTLIYTDAVTDYSPIARLHGLRRFELMLGNITDAAAIPSIGFFAGLDALEEVRLFNLDISDRRLDALYELPRLRFVHITGRAGPDVDELRRRRPDVEVESHLTGDPPGRVHVGPFHYDPPIEGIPRWSIFQDVSDLLGASTNDGAERALRRALRGRDPELLARLQFDSESGAMGVYAASEEDIRAVVELLRDLAGSAG